MDICIQQRLLQHQLGQLARLTAQHLKLGNAPLEPLGLLAVLRGPGRGAQLRNARAQHRRVRAVCKGYLV